MYTTAYLIYGLKFSPSQDDSASVRALLAHQGMRRFFNDASGEDAYCFGLNLCSFDSTDQGMSVPVMELASREKEYRHNYDALFANIPEAYQKSFHGGEPCFFLVWASS